MEVPKIQLLKTCVLFLVLVVAIATGAQDLSRQQENATYISGQAVSEARSNVCLVVFNKTRDHPQAPSTEVSILFGFVSTDGAHYDICLLRPEYGYRISAVSQDGRTIEKNRAGGKYGQKFDDVKSYDRRMLEMSGRRETPYLTMATPDVPPTRTLSPLGELFQFEKPGRYAITLELQVFAGPLHGPSTNRQVIRFPPVKFQVIKPEPKATVD